MGTAVPVRSVNAVAPVRICDIGGWTDTWFAGHGKVLNIAVSPHVAVQVVVWPAEPGQRHITIDARNFAERYTYPHGELPGRHPLLEAVIDEMGVPADVSLEISAFSEMPVGAATGTSAATAVALIGALDSLVGGSKTAHEVAEIAQRIEFDRLGRQSGIQDQLCSAYGGINYIKVDPFPHASVSQIALPDDVWSELERRVLLLYFGRPHVSSKMHERVIARLTEEGGSSPQLEELRRCAEGARDALRSGDLVGLGDVMKVNTEAQRRLHPELVSAQAEAAIEIAAAHGALGWKVNGAGGEGGSLTVLCGPEMTRKLVLIETLLRTQPSFRVIPVVISREGLRVWQI